MSGMNAESEGVSGTIMSTATAGTSSSARTALMGHAYTYPYAARCRSSGSPRYFVRWPTTAPLTTTGVPEKPCSGDHLREQQQRVAALVVRGAGVHDLAVQGKSRRGGLAQRRRIGEFWKSVPFPD